MTLPVHQTLSDGRPRARWPVWLVILTLSSVAYVSVATVDATFGSVPLKLLLVAATVAGWAAVRLRYRDLPLPPSWRLIVLAALILPVVWFAVTEIRIGAGDPSQRHGVHYALQEGSRFLYLLLYLPLYDVLGGSFSDPVRVLWRTAGGALCVATLLLWLVHALGLGDGLPFLRDALGSDAGTLRIFAPNDIILVPALAMALAGLWIGGASRSRLIELTALLATTYLAHARGLWIGVCAAIACALTLGSAWELRSRAVRRAVLTGVGLGALAVLAVSADPDLAGGVSRALFQSRVISNGLLYQQTPQLLSAAASHPFFGAGLGATLPSGYFRSGQSPWSFEVAYLQLAFQLGIVGTLLLALLPGYVALKAAVRPPSDRGARVRLAFGLGSLFGFLLACTSNPYLLTSVGMLALAGIIVTIDTVTSRSRHPYGVATRTEPNDERGSPDGPSSTPTAQLVMAQKNRTSKTRRRARSTT